MSLVIGFVPLFYIIACKGPSLASLTSKIASNTQLEQWSIVKNELVPTLQGTCLYKSPFIRSGQVYIDAKSPDCTVSAWVRYICLLWLFLLIGHLCFNGMLFLGVASRMDSKMTCI
jgi:hypothetical protein